MRRPNEFSPPLTRRVGRVLGRLRRSEVLAGATTFAGRQRLGACQRWRGRFVRGVWLQTRDYLANNPSAGRVIHTAFPPGRTLTGGPTYVPADPAATPGGPIGVRYGPRIAVCLHNPWILGLEGAVIAPDRRLLWDLSYEWPGQPHRHPIYAEMSPHAVDLPGTTVTLAAMGAGKNYFHFLCNSVARLAYLPSPGPDFAPDRYLVSGEVTPFVAETLALFGVSRERLLGLASYPALRPERLVAPSLVEHPFVVPAHICAFLRERILAHVPPGHGPRRRIFVDRSDAPARRIRNLDALAEVLAEFGVDSVRLTGRSVMEQAQLFRDAELVIANHGAALTNLVFCEPGTRVLQVLAPGMTEREYRTIARHGGLTHDYLAAEFATSADAHLPRKDRDLVLSPVALRTVLDREFSRRPRPAFSA